MEVFKKTAFIKVKLLFIIIIMSLFEGNVQQCAGSGQLSGGIDSDSQRNSGINKKTAEGT